MSTKLLIQIYQPGKIVSKMANLVATHNKGYKEYTLKSIQRFLNDLNATDPDLAKMRLKFTTDQVIIRENGNDETLLIEIAPVYEMRNYDRDDMGKWIAPPDALNEKNFY